MQRRNDMTGARPLGRFMVVVEKCVECFVSRSAFTLKRHECRAPSRSCGSAL